MEEPIADIPQSPTEKPPEGPLRKPARKKWFSLRATVSLTLLSTFLILVASGAILFLSPRGQVARWSAWQVWGISREEWTRIHLNSAGMMLLLSVFHLLLNWRLLSSYLQRAVRLSLPGKAELLIAVGLAGLCFIGSARLWPGFQLLPKWRDQLRSQWESRLFAPPVAHLEEWSLGKLAAAAGVDPQELVAAGKELGATELSDQSTLADLASQTGQSPREVFDQLAAKIPELRDVQIRPGQGRGQGRGASHQAERASGEGPRGEGRAGEGARWGGGRGPGWGRGRWFHESPSSPEQ